MAETNKTVNNPVKKLKYIGKTIHFFFIGDDRYCLKPNEIVKQDISGSNEVKKLLKEKKIIEI